jgi:hypothetical protein
MPKVNHDALDSIMGDMAVGHDPIVRSIESSCLEVERILTSLNSSGAYDSYDITTKNIKKLRESNNFISHINKLWNFMAYFGYFPQCFKFDKIIYIWKKKGNKTEAKYYRPITLVAGISKIMEGLLNKKLDRNIVSPIGDHQHAYIPGKSIQTAVLSLEEKIINLKTQDFAVVFVDLKGAFESVSHELIHRFYSLSNPKLANLCKSYLGNRCAHIFNSNYPSDKPNLEYLANRSTPQGSKVSPTIFNHNLGVICYWFQSRIFLLSEEMGFKIDYIVYADDIAIIVGSDSGIPELLKALSLCVSCFREIANILGGELEPSKTEILVPTNRTWTDIDNLAIEGTVVTFGTSVKWLGYMISFSVKGALAVSIPVGKLFALQNICRIFKSYNSSCLDCRRFFMIYIRPVIDLWLFNPSLHKQLELEELKLIRILMNIHRNSSKREIYEHFAYEDPATRSIRLFGSMFLKGIIPNIPIAQTLPSGKNLVLPASYKTTKERLSVLYISYKHEMTRKNDKPVFNKTEFVKWRSRSKRQIAKYAQSSRVASCI